MPRATKKRNPSRKTSSPEPHLLSPRGFAAGAVYAGIKSRRSPDVALLVCEQLATAAAVFTTNRVVAAPVMVARQHLAQTSGMLRGVVVNAGNANACTGERGLRDARRMCAIAARAIRSGTGANSAAAAETLLPCSTGIIGHLLPMQKVERGILAAARKLGDTREHATRFADAILTTDTRRKSAAARVKIGGETVTIAGVCKGSGMIGPRMALPSRVDSIASASSHATMLAFLTTDAAVNVPLLRNLLQGASDRSFNAVTVDDHTSTNDTAVILASGATGASVESPEDIERFSGALNEVCQSLAYQIAADGEGATKVVTVVVDGAISESDARMIARAIANSPLVKCAMHGNDPNWGRIVSAAGLAGVPFESERATLRLQGTAVFRRGGPVRFDLGKVSRSLDAAEVRVELNCGLGSASATVWTCDLSKRYVTINADYHT
jgi:glutamate N-acetyltransferase/amino-acid N-acetyltransferase